MTSFGLKVFQTAFAGEAHATVRQRVDTVLPIGFDCLICRSHSHVGGNPDLGISEIFQGCCISNLCIFAYFPFVGGNGNNGNGRARRAFEVVWVKIQKAAE